MSNGLHPLRARFSKMNACQRRINPNNVGFLCWVAWLFLFAISMLYSHPAKAVFHSSAEELVRACQVWMDRPDRSPELNCPLDVSEHFQVLVAFLDADERFRRTVVAWSPETVSGRPNCLRHGAASITSGHMLYSKSHRRAVSLILGWAAANPERIPEKPRALIRISLEDAGWSYD